MPFSVENFLPISITSAVSKVFEHLVSVHLRRFMERSGVLPTAQFVYRIDYYCAPRGSGWIIIGVGQLGYTWSGWEWVVGYGLAVRNSFFFHAYYYPIPITMHDFYGNSYVWQNLLLSILLSSHPLLFVLFYSCCSHARVFGKTLVHELHISDSHAECRPSDAAFDKINHWGILYGLCSVGIGCPVLSVLSQFL